MKQSKYVSYRKILHRVVLLGTVAAVGGMISSVSAADTSGTANTIGTTGIATAIGTAGSENTTGFTGSANGTGFTGSANTTGTVGTALNTVSDNLKRVNAMDSLTFSNRTYETRTMIVDGKDITFRAYENIPYVANPIDTTYQSMNVYIPEAYFHEEKDGKYTADTAPIFLPNSVGGYRPGKAATPTVSKSGEPNAVLYALSRGYVVAAPGARGRSNQSEDGTYYGKAPTAIVDLKAAVAYLHKNDAIMPGDANRIVSNGTSAGGALSLLLGASGNSRDYASYLAEVGAASDRTDIFAVSAYCPITDLDHADMAYEWSYAGVNSYTGMQAFGGQMEPPDPTLGSGVPDRGKPPTGNNQPAAEAISLTDDQILYSQTLKLNFPTYVNSLHLTDKNGKPLTMAADGTGSFMDYAKSYIINSAEKAKVSGTDISDASYLIYDTKNPQKIVDVDWLAYNTSVGRMKTPGAFDARDNTTGENNLFGTPTVDNQHFTQFASAYGDGSAVADRQIIKMMNPLNYIEPNAGSKTKEQTQHWRIRYGEIDNNTSMAVPLIVSTRLANYGYDVDFALPWGVPHSGDYDLQELFDWIDQVVAKK